MLVLEATKPLQPPLPLKKMCRSHSLNAKIVLEATLPLPLNKPLLLPLNKPHTQNLVGADGSKDAGNTMVAATQEDADSTMAAIAREGADNAVMAARVPSRAQRTIARHQRKTSTRTATRIIISNKRVGNYHMAAGDPAAGER